MEEKGGKESSMIMTSYDPRASFKPERVVPYNNYKRTVVAAVVLTNKESKGDDKNDKIGIINKNDDRRSKNSAASTIPMSIENKKKEKKATTKTTTTTTQQQQQLVTVPQRLISSWSSSRRESGHSSTSMSTSLLLEGGGVDTTVYNDSFTDLYNLTKGGGGDLCEEFVERQRRQSYDSKISKQQQKQISMRSLQPQDEINPNKPWLTIPPTTTTNGEEYTLGLDGVGGGNTTYNQAKKRGSVITTRSSIESSLTESFLLTILQSKYDITATNNDNGTMIDTCRIDNDDTTAVDEDAAVTTTTTSDNDVAHSATDRGGEEMSVLSVDDDGSELTELRQAQEALFNGRSDSVVSNSSNKHQMQNISELDVIVQDEEEEIEVRRRHSLSDQLDETEPFLEVNDLDYEEIDPRRRRRRNNPQSSTNNPFSSSSSSSSSSNPFSGDSDEESKSERRYDVDYRLESVKTTPVDSRRDLLSYAQNDISRRASDDSVSYSDIDPEVPPPSIKMCMTVRDTMIEREFDTIQLADIEYGEKKTKKKSTLEDLFEGDDDLDASYTSSQCERSHPSKYSSKTGKFATNLTDKKRVLMDGMVKTAAITTKLGHTRSAKNIRRKNKRRWKYCVWNCRKITLVVVLSLTLIIGVGILSRWGYSKQLSNAAETESENDSVVIMEGTPPLEGGPALVPTMFPSLPEGGGLESMSTDPQAPLNTTSNSSYPTPSLISSNTSSSFPTISGIHNNHTYNSSQSLHPSATIIANSSSIMNISSQSSLSPTSSPSTLTNATLIYNSSSYPSTSPSSNTTLFNRSDILYESIQIIKGSNAFEHAGSSVSMSPDGEFIAVGYKEADGLAAKKTGLVRVYQRNSMNTSYTSLGRDSMYGKATDDEFGASVSISNDGHRVAVGARSSSSMDKVKNGEVIVFEYSNISQSWLQLGIPIQGMQDAARHGFSVSLSGDGFRLAVGAPKDNGGTGSVGVYDYNYESKEWVILDDFIFGEADGDRTGFSVSLSNDGSTVAVGSAFTSSSNGDLSSSGSTAVYKIEGGYDSNSSISLIKQGQTLVGANDDAQFGYSVSLSSSGTRLAVGSNGFRSKNLTKVGRCAVYELRQENWIEIGHFIGTEENEETGLYVAIAVNGNVVSCSKINSVGGASIGSVAILEEVKAGWNVLDVIGASLGKSSSFGAYVSLSRDGKWIVAGDPSYYSSKGFVEILTRLE